MQPNLNPLPSLRPCFRPARVLNSTSLLLVLMTELTRATTVLTQGHVDIGIGYDHVLKQWDLHVHDEGRDIEYNPPSTAVLSIGASSQTRIPDGPAWSFLGVSGQSTWILPQNQTPGLLYLGIGTEEIEPGVFAGDTIQLTLRSASGPGAVSVFDLDPFGNPVLSLGTGDGITAADTLSLNTGSHSHLNWAFSAPGDYVLMFQAAGSAAEDGTTMSELAEYRFQVEAIPEPQTPILMILGGLTAAAAAWCRKRSPRFQPSKGVRP